MKPKVKKPSAPQSKARVVRPSVTNPIELPEGMRERTPGRLRASGLAGCRSSRHGGDS